MYVIPQAPTELRGTLRRSSRVESCCLCLQHWSSARSTTSTPSPHWVRLCRSRSATLAAQTHAAWYQELAIVLLCAPTLWVLSRVKHSNRATRSHVFAW